MPLSKIKKQLNKLEPAVCLTYAELLISICSCAGLASAHDGKVDIGSLQQSLLRTACTFLNRTADLDEADEENSERVTSVREETDAFEREVREHCELASLIDGLTAAGSEGLKARPVVRYRMRF